MTLRLLTGTTNMRDIIFIGHERQIVGTKDSTDNLEGGMTQPNMPLLRRRFYGTETHLAGR
jgi:hypothetical protein